jgi:hypothetical protein
LNKLEENGINVREWWEGIGMPPTFEDAINDGNVRQNSDGNFSLPTKTQTINVDGIDDDYQLILSDNEEEPTEENNEGTEEEESDENNPEKFQNGGQMSVIPDGKLHARRHNIEEQAEETNPDLDLKGNITHKGIPVVAIEEGGKVE